LNHLHFCRTGDAWNLKVERSMRSYLRRIGIAALAALSIAGAVIASTGPASAHFRGWHGGWHGGWHHGWHGGWGPRAFAPAFVGGLALGALAAPAYYGDCFPRRRVVGFTPWGDPIVRWRPVCY
jgi:hypothetical protein